MPFKRTGRLGVMRWSNRENWRGKGRPGGVVEPLSHTHKGEERMRTNTCSSRKNWRRHISDPFHGKFSLEWNRDHSKPISHIYSDLQEAGSEVPRPQPPDHPSMMTRHIFNAISHLPLMTLN